MNLFLRPLRPLSEGLAFGCGAVNVASDRALRAVTQWVAGSPTTIRTV